MKKRTMVLGGLLMAVAVTGYSVAGTYAKYISTIGGTESARVAKWSFNDAQEFDLFKESYNNGTVKSLGCDAAGDNCDDILAPGTSGHYTFQLNQDGLKNVVSEVNYKVTLKVGGVNNALVEIKDKDDLAEIQALRPYEYVTVGSTNYYSPIKFALVDGTTVPAEDSNEWDNSFDEILSKLRNEFAELTSGATATEETDPVKGTIQIKSVVKGADLISAAEDIAIFNKIKTLAWKWDYNDPSADAIKDNPEAIKKAELLSKYDTKLGNKAAEGKDATNVSLTFEISFEQTQELAN